MAHDDVEVVTQREQQFVTAWKKGDAKAAAAVFTEDGVRVGAFGDVQHGRAEIEAGYDKLFNGPMKGASLDWEPHVRLLTADVAIAEGPMTITPPGGGPLKGYALDIWVKKNGSWYLAEGTPKLFPPPPGAPAKR